MNKNKKISYISMIIFVIASTIGAGIFFKNKELLQIAQGDVVFVIATWIIAAIGMMALGLALIEISSSQKTDRGVFEWTKQFTNKLFHKSSVNYSKYIFIPISLFTLPIYVTSTFEDAGLVLGNGWLALLVSFAIFAWFMIIGLISLKFAEINQWIFTLVKIIPLLVLPIISIFFSELSEGHTFLLKSVESRSGLTGSTKWLIVLAGVPAISFAYDNFYSITSLKEQVREKDKNKMGIAIIIGLIIITAFYLFLSISFAKGSKDGTHFGITFFDNHPQWMNFFNFTIAVGIMGIVNSLTMSSPYQIRGLAQIDEAKEVVWLNKIFKNSKMDDNKKLLFSSWIAVFAITTIFFVIFGSIGIVLYQSDDWGSFDIYGTGTYLYSFSDILVNYTSLLIFLIICGSVIGGLVNRKTNKVSVKKEKYFIPTAIFAVILFYSSFIFVIIASIIDMTGYNGADVSSSILKFSIFIIILILSIVPAWISIQMQKKKKN